MYGITELKYYYIFGEKGRSIVGYRCQIRLLSIFLVSLIFRSIKYSLWVNYLKNLSAIMVNQHIIFKY